MRLTKRQQDAVDHRGSNLLVSASAGSGKTEVLARRCVGLIADPAQPCDVERLLVVTFTRAAAAELRVRIAQALHKQAAATSDACLRNHLRRQELLVDAADIGTIDAWCGRVVRAHYDQLGIDPDYTVLTVEDAALLRAEVLDELMAHIQRGDPDPLWDAARAWIGRGTSPDERFLRQMIQQLNRFREHLVSPCHWLQAQRTLTEQNDASAVLATAIANECQLQHEQLLAMLPTLPDDAGAILAPYATSLETWAAEVTTGADVQTVVAAIDGTQLTKRGQRNVPQIVKTIKTRWLENRLQKKYKPELVANIIQRQPACNTLLRHLLDLEARYDAALRQRKTHAASYEFADVLRMTLDLLGTDTGAPRRTPTPIARRLQARYEHILVDEYQDTSPVQVEALRLITRQPPQATNRFMVGDVKQSIYGFRQAEPRLFSELIEAFEAGAAAGKVHYLPDNFRSHTQLLDTLNELFARLFDRELGGTSFGTDERLAAKRSEVANPTLDAQPRVSVHILREADASAADDTDDEVGVERMEREAQLAAAEIQQLFAADTQVPQREPDGTVSLRPLCRSDIVVLLRSAKQNAPLAARVLRDNGIACVAAGREALLDSIEVQDVCTILTLLVNRRQDVPLAAYLRGPAVGLDPQALLDIRSAKPHGDFHDASEHYRAQRPDERLAARLDRALAQLDRWAVAARECDVPTLLQKILRDSGLPTFALGLRGGRQRAVLLDALQNVAVAFNSTGRNSAEFVDYLESLASEDIDPGALTAAEEDVVRVMTIHASKGLEFPVVFLLGAGSAFNNISQRLDLQCDTRGGLGLRFKDYPARAELQSARHLVIKQLVAQRELEEELRLLYVATTRAKERLFISGYAKDDAWEKCLAEYATVAQPPLVSRLSVANRLEWVLMATAAGRLHETTTDRSAPVEVIQHDESELPLSTPGRQEPPAPGDDPTPAVQAWIDRGRRLIEMTPDRALVEFPAVLSVSALKELAQRDRSADAPQVLDLPASRLAAPRFATSPGAPAGSDVGTAVHRFLELADLRRLGSVGDVRAQLDALTTNGRLPPKQAALVNPDDIAWLAATDVGRRLAAEAEHVRRELPFVFALPVGQTNERAIVRGIIDVLVKTDDGLVLIDYKTDAIDSDTRLDERVRLYSTQMQLYAWAAGDILGRPVTRATLAFLRARRIVDVPPELPPLAQVLDAALGHHPPPYA